MGTEKMKLSDYSVTLPKEPVYHILEASNKLAAMPMVPYSSHPATLPLHLQLAQYHSTPNCCSFLLPQYFKVAAKCSVSHKDFLLSAPSLSGLANPTRE